MNESLKKNINNFFLGVNLTLITIICLCFFYWKENIQRIILSYVFTARETKGTIAQKKISEIYPKLFTARFYLLDEKTQMEEAGADVS